jgi:ankyrin repeat protein
MVNRESANTHFPLHDAVLRADEDEVRRLLSEGSIDVNELDDLGNTALHWTAFGNYPVIARMLIEHGADVNVLSDDGVTPLWRAEDFGLEELAVLLRRHGGIARSVPVPVKDLISNRLDSVLLGRRIVPRSTPQEHRFTQI